MLFHISWLLLRQKLLLLLDVYLLFTCIRSMMMTAAKHNWLFDFVHVTSYQLIFHNIFVPLFFLFLCSSGSGHVSTARYGIEVSNEINKTNERKKSKYENDKINRNDEKVFKTNSTIQTIDKREMMRKLFYYSHRWWFLWKNALFSVGYIVKPSLAVE